MIEVTRMRSIHSELESLNAEDLSAEFYDDESLVPWYFVIRAFEALRTKKNGVYPG